ncbi:MAG: hypothetical protein ACE5F1_17555 [Planctomycetota bacterium]
MKRQHIVSSLGLALSILACAASGIAWTRLPGDHDSAQFVMKRDMEPSERHLGEKMNALARRFASLWFAGQNEHWGLASYEIHEIGEIIEEIAEFGLVERGINIAGVLKGVYNTNFGALSEQAKAGSKEGFEKAYHATIEACNSCHRQAGHVYLRITLPREPPVQNRSWIELVPDPASEQPSGTER